MPFSPQSILLDSRFVGRVESRHIDWFNGRCAPRQDIVILANGSVASGDDSGSCESCDDRIHYDDLVSVTDPRRAQGYRSRRPAEIWCAPCVRRKGFECPDCRKTFHTDRACGSNTAGESVCESCAENYFYCEGCNATCNNDNYAEDGHCRSCFDSSATAVMPDQKHRPS